MEADLPTLREIMGGEWKKEVELKGLKSEVAALERQIQLTIAPPEPTNNEATEQEQAAITAVKESPMIIIPQKPPTT